MRRVVVLCSSLALICAAAPAKAGGFFGFFSDPDPQCYWCIRDAIYHDYKLIAHLEANPDIDDAVRGPQIVVARADIQRLRWLLGPVQDVRIEPCCYARPPLHIR
jgi:hypothetical protein